MSWCVCLVCGGDSIHTAPVWKRQTQAFQPWSTWVQSAAFSRVMTNPNENIAGCIRLFPLEICRVVRVSFLLVSVLHVSALRWGADLVNFSWRSIKYLSLFGSWIIIVNSSFRLMLDWRLFMQEFSGVSMDKCQCACPVCVWAAGQ